MLILFQVCQQILINTLFYQSMSLTINSVEGDCSIRAFWIFLSGKNSQPFSQGLPIMLALCLMLSGTHCAKNYASIILPGL